MKSSGFKYSSLVRWIILGIILLVSMIFNYLHLTGGVRYPSVHAICPYGGIENLWAWISARANIQKIFSGTMTLFFMTIIFAIIFRRSFCGNICPFGGLQELIGLVYKKKYTVPKKIDKYLRLIKYAVLLLSVVMAWITMTLWLSPFDPWAAFAHISDLGELVNGYAIGGVILLITLVSSIFIKRFFCKYLCPAGALYAIFGKLSFFKIKRNSKTCINCEKCSKKCPMDIEVHKTEEVKSIECISCMRCIDVCPDPGTMIAAKVSRFNINPLLVVIISVVIFFGSVFVLDSVGLMTVSLPTQAAVQEKGDFIGMQDLRGSMTIEQGAFYTGKTVEEFYTMMEIPVSVPKETQLKNISFYVPGYDFHTMKATQGSQ